MLKLDPKTILDEKDAGIARRDLYLENEREVVTRIHGPGFLREAKAYVDHENFGFEWYALHAAKLVASNPRVEMTSFGSREAMSEAQLLKQAQQQDIELSNMRRLMQDTFPAWAAMWFVTVTQSEPMPGEEGNEYPMHQARTTPLSRRDFFLDCHAKRWANAKIVGHKVAVSKADLLERARAHPDEQWDVAAIRAMKPVGNPSRLEPDDQDTRTSGVDRDTVEFWSIWLEQDSKEALRNAGIKKSQMRAADNGDKLFSGTIVTIADASSTSSLRWLRPPRPHFGAPSDDEIRGPYVMHGCYTVEDHPFPLSPILAVWHQNNELNAHVDRMLQHSRKARSFDAVDGLNSDDNEKLKNAKDGDVLVVNGLDKNRIANFKTDGLTTEDLDAYTVLKVRRNESAGMPQSARGAVESTTATSVDRAAEASDTRAEFCAQRHADGWCAVLRQRAWFLRNDERTILRLKDGLYLGGFNPEKSIRYALGRKLIRPEEADELLQPERLQAMQILRLPWQQLSIKIDLFSMQRTSASVQQARLQTGLASVVDAAQVMPAAPFLRWQLWLDRMGESLNWTDFSELMDLEAFQQYVQAQMQAQAQAAQGEGAVRAAVRSPGLGAKAAPGPASPKSQQKPKTGTSGNSSGAALAGAAKSGR